MPSDNVLKRELRVAFSRRAQPVWFRVVKWALLLGLGALYWRRAAFWWSILALAVVGAVLHLIWRWKTKAWTEPWGGWDDVDAGRRR